MGEQEREGNLEIQTTSGSVRSVKEAKVYIQELGTYLVREVGGRLILFRDCVWNGYDQEKIPNERTLRRPTHAALTTLFLPSRSQSKKTIPSLETKSNWARPRRKGKPLCQERKGRCSIQIAGALLRQDDLRRCSTPLRKYHLLQL